MHVLTRDEAVERRRLLDVRCASVELDLTRGAEVFGSRTEIRFGCTAPGASTFLDVKPARLLRVVLNGRELDPAALDGGRFPLADLAADNELLVEADMAYSHTGEGMHRYTDPADGAVYVYTQSFLDDGPRVFASFDQPDLKAAYQVAVTAPAGWTVVGNGEPAERPAEGEAGRWVLTPTQPISSYLVSVVAGPLHSIRSEHDGIPLGLHCRRSLASYLDADAAEILDATRRSFDHYHRIFRQRYPFGGYDQCFVPEFNAGAMENPGCVTFRDEFVFRSQVTGTEREERAIVVAHEMAHMWFGDLVTMRWWDDLWLNESFAEFMAYQTISTATAFTGAWTGFGASRKNWGYDADQRRSTHPVAPADVDDTAAALQNFDGISYAKGAAVLRQLVAWLGEEAFLEGVNRYFDQHAFGNAGLHDLLTALAGATGRDVQGWAERWLRTSGVDTVRAERAEEPDRAVLTHASADGVLRPQALSVAAYERTLDGRLALRSRETVELDPDAGDAGDAAGAGATAGSAGTAESGGPAGEGPGAVLPLPGQAAPELLVLNDTDMGYVKTRLDAASWATVRYALGDVPEEAARAVLWTEARDRTRDGEFSGADHLDLVAAHLPGETSVHLAEAVLGFARGTVVDRYLRPDQRAEGLAALAGVCRTLLRRTEGFLTDTGLRLVAVRGLIAASATPAETAELRMWLEEGAVPGGPELDPDLRWRVLERLTVLGQAGPEEIEAELVRDPGTTAELGAARCRAALPDRAAKEAAWAALFPSSARSAGAGAGGTGATAAEPLSNALVGAVARGFWQPEQAELLADLTLRYFDDVVATAAERGPAVARLLTGPGFPAHAAVPATVLAAERCLERDDLTAALRRGLDDSLDDLRRAVSARALEGK